MQLSSIPVPTKPAKPDLHFKLAAEFLPAAELRASSSSSLLPRCGHIRTVFLKVVNSPKCHQVRLWDVSRRRYLRLLTEDLRWRVERLRLKVCNLAVFGGTLAWFPTWANEPRPRLGGHQPRAVVATRDRPIGLYQLRQIVLILLKNATANQH